MKDQSSLLRYLYRNATSKYLKFRQRIDKAVQSGRFHRFSKRKRSSLLSRIRRLRERINALALQLKLAGAGLAFSLACAITNTAEAQTTLGPYEQKTRRENPLREPYGFLRSPRPASVDWDNDEDLDIVVGNYGNLRYFENNPLNGRSVFEEKVGSENPFEDINISAYRNDSAPVFLDFDQDGDMDLFIGTDMDDADAIFYFKNENGVLEWQDPTIPWDNDQKTGNPFYSLTSAILGSGYLLDPYAKMTFVKWDTDDDYDVFIGQDDAPYLFYFENNLDASQEWTPRPLTDIGFDAAFTTNGNGQAPQYADFDDDGDSDFIIGSSAGGLVFMANDGSGNYAEQTGPWSTEFKTGNPFHDIAYEETTPHTVDLDDDGDFDILMGRYEYYFDHPLVYLVNNGNGEFEEKTDLENPMGGLIGSGDNFLFDKALLPELLDMDNDGDLDLLLGDKYDSDVRYFRNDEGEFVKADSPLGSIAFTFESYPSAVDIDSDGDNDIFVAEDGDAYTPAVRFFRNNGNGTFTEEPAQNPLNIPYVVPIALNFVDVDNDNDFDVWVTTDGDRIFYRNNTPSPGASVVFDEDDINDPLQDYTFSFRTRFEAVDIDGDSDQDIIEGSDVTGIRLFINEGNEVFTEFTGVDNPFDFFAESQLNMAFADYDNDGDQDLFVNTYGGEFRYIRNENPAPILGTSAPLELVMSSEPQIISTDFGLTDSDNDKYVKVVVSIVGYEQGLDLVDYDESLVGAFSDISFDEDKGELQFWPSDLATGEDIEAMLATITYQYTGGDIGSARKRGGSNKRTITKTIRFEVFDADRTNPVPLDFTITHPNEVPTLSSTAPDITYTPAAGAIVIDNTVLVSDNDDNDIHSATIRIIGYQSGQDELLFTNANGISALPFDTSTGTLTLNGIASLADYQTALRSVQYRNNASVPNGTPRTFEFNVSDGESFSAMTSVDLQVNNAPQLNLSQTGASYQASAIGVDNAMTVTDDFSIQQVVISISSGLDATEDALLYTGVAPITSSFTAATGTLVLTGPASAAQFQAALRSVQYSNSDPDVGETPRVITIQLTDDAGNNSAAATITINFTVQSPPVVSSSVTNISYTSGTLVINNDITLSDADNTDLQSATIIISSGLVSSEDVLSFSPSGGISGTYNATTGILTLTGSASLATYQTVLRSVAYENTNTGDRNKISRTIAFRVNDGTDNSNTFGTTLTIPNQAPVVTANASTPPYESGTLIIADQLTLNDVDNATMQSATIAITSGLVASEDVLSFTPGNGIAGMYNPGTGTLSLIGAASLASYETALRSVTYENTNSGDRNKNPRTISFQINDGMDDSNTSNATLILPNALPVIAANSNAPLYGSGALVIAGQLTLDDTDNATMQSATVTITSGLAIGEDVLVFTNQNGITGTYMASSGTLVLSGSASEADYQAALRTVAYQNTSATPSETPRVVSIIIHDGLSSSTAATITIEINRAPIITPQQSVIGAGGQVSIDLNNIATDPDNNLDLSNISLISIVNPPSSGAEATIVGGTLILNYANVPDFTGTDQLTLEICDNLNRCAVQILSIEVGGDIEVFNAVSQNGDGVNDFLFLRYIKPNNRVTIYNRWGDKVFEMDNYDNTIPGKRFEGFNNNGNALATGTYFYKVEYGIEVIATGYLSLKQ